MTTASIEDGRLLRSVSKSGKVNRDTLSDWAVWSVVEQSSKRIGIERFVAHDLRRACAKLCRKNGGDLEQIKFLLGHSSIQTTERYLGSEQDMEIAVNGNEGKFFVESSSTLPASRFGTLRGYRSITLLVGSYQGTLEFRFSKRLRLRIVTTSQLIATKYVEESGNVPCHIRCKETGMYSAR
jgi:hypothetical protein